MRTAVTPFLLCLWILGLLCLSSCGDGNISKGEAKEIIEKYMGKCYGLAVPARVTLTSPPDIRYQHVRLARALELVDTAQAPDASGPRASDTYDVTLTEKGGSHPHFEDNRKNTMFLVSENRIDEIIEVKKENKKQFTVLFAYTQNYNDLGKEIANEAQQHDLSWIENGSKLRGRVTLVYDSYLKSYVAQGMMWSEWEKENWKPALLARNDKKETAFYYSYERREQSTSTMQPSLPASGIHYGGRSREIQGRITEKRESMMEEQRRRAERNIEAMQRANEDRQRELDRERTRMELKNLERQAEIIRMNEERARRDRERAGEFDRRVKEKELNKKLLR